jgi:hypothetical protein
MDNPKQTSGRGALGHYQNPLHHRRVDEATTSSVTPPPASKSHTRLRRSNTAAGKLPTGHIQSASEAPPPTGTTKRFSQHRHTSSLSSNRPWQPTHSRQTSAGPYAGAAYTDYSYANDPEVMSDLSRKISKLREHTPSIHGSLGHKKDATASSAEPIRELSEAETVRRKADEAAKENMKAESRNRFVDIYPFHNSISALTDESGNCGRLCKV